MAPLFLSVLYQKSQKKEKINANLLSNYSPVFFMLIKNFSRTQKHSTDEKTERIWSKMFCWFALLWKYFLQKNEHQSLLDRQAKNIEKKVENVAVENVSVVS